MSDNEIIALRERMTGYGKKPLIVELHQLADEALARGAAWEQFRDLLDEAQSDNKRLRERTAQLDTALRWYAAAKHWARDAHGGYCDADLDRGDKARAALAAEKP